MAKSTSKLFKDEEPKKMKEDAMNLPTEKKEEVVVPATPSAPVDDIQDVDISAIKKKRFRINGDNNKILELNVSDMNIASRMSAAYERLQKHMEEVGAILADVPEDSEITPEVQEAVESHLDAIDTKMRNELDYIFQAPVSEVCADGGSMYDPFEGAFRFEHIIESLSKLYENNLAKEFERMRKRITVKTSKYTKKYHN